MRTAALLRHVHPLLQTFFCRSCAVYMRLNGFAHSHLRHASLAYRRSAMTFEEILDQAIAMLQRRGRLTYGTLKRQFHLDDAALDDLKEQLLYAHPQVVDDAERGLVWTGETTGT